MASSLSRILKVILMSQTLRQMVLLASGLALLVIVGTPFVPTELSGQVNNNLGNNNQGNNLNNQNAGGIKIDPNGVVSLALTSDTTGALDPKRREAAARATLNADVNRPAKTRYVSLVEWERAIEDHLARQTPIPDELFYFAGVQQIEDVYVFPESGDLVIAGPAEGFAPDAVGRRIGVNSRRPTLRLDDCVIALRTIGRIRVAGCSIDPVPERLANLIEFIKQGGPANAAVVEARFRQMDEILGLQTVRVDGVPADSHFAVALVEADYRMKRIAMGLENPGVRALKSHLAMLGREGNTMQRWWFVPLYDSISRSEDGLAYRFAGQRLQLLAEEELADAQGNRFAAATTRLSTQTFAKVFTDKFPELVQKSPIFAELQNLTDWLILAALLQKERLSERVAWKQATLRDENRLALPQFHVPKQVPSSVNFKRAGNLVVGLVGGGVVILPDQTVEKSLVTAGPELRLDSSRGLATSAPRPDSHRWWWDAP